MSRGFVVKAGKALPELSNPAGAAQILSGYQAIDREGKVLTGTATKTTSCSVRIVVETSSVGYIRFCSETGIKGMSINRGNTYTLSGLFYTDRWYAIAGSFSYADDGPYNIRLSVTGGAGSVSASNTRMPAFVCSGNTLTLTIA